MSGNELLLSVCRSTESRACWHFFGGVRGVPGMRLRRVLLPAVLTLAAVLWTASAAVAAESLCDAAYQNCRNQMLDLIRAERVRIDASFWFMEDSRYSTELIKRWQARAHRQHHQRIRIRGRRDVDPGEHPDHPDGHHRLRRARGHQPHHQRLHDRGHRPRQRAMSAAILIVKTASTGR
jgi:hypothetical protein